MNRQFSPDAARRRSRRAIAVFVVLTLIFAGAVGVSRYLEMAAFAPSAEPAQEQP